jgi:hypothetical protein
VIGTKVRINNLQNFNKCRPAITKINRSKFKKAKLHNNEVQVKMHSAKKYRENKE